MKKFSRKACYSIVCLILLVIFYYVGVVRTDFVKKIFDEIDEYIGNIMIIGIGVISLGSGLLGWRLWGVRASIRKTKYGEIINTVVMTCVGLAAIIIGILGL